MILTKGILHYDSLLKASSASKKGGGSYDNNTYSVSILIHKNDKKLLDLQNSFDEAMSQYLSDSGETEAPPSFYRCFFDCSVGRGIKGVNGFTEKSGDLKDYWSLTLRQKEAQGRPDCTDMNSMPVSQEKIKIGEVIWVRGAFFSYTDGTGGISAFLNGSLITGDKGKLPRELLSNKPTQAQGFADVDGFNDALAETDEEF